VTQAWIAGSIVTSCKCMTLRSRHSSIVVSDQVRLVEYIHPDTCFAIEAFGYPTALCPCCALFLDVLGREPAPPKES